MGQKNPDYGRFLRRMRGVPKGGLEKPPDQRGAAIRGARKMRGKPPITRIFLPQQDEIGETRGRRIGRCARERGMGDELVSRRYAQEQGMGAGDARGIGNGGGGAGAVDAGG